MKYAKINKNVDEVISYQTVDGLEQESDKVYDHMIRKEDGTFDYTDEFKEAHAEVIE